MNRNSNPPQCTCKPGFFDDNINSDCQPCQAPCGNCVDEATKCTSCESQEYVLENNIC